jgi:general secretion pathway protein G
VFVKKSRSHILNQRGFSLIEIMIVLGLIGGIVALIATKVSGARDNGDVKITKAGMRQVMDQLEMYNQDCNSYPTTEQGLEALVKQPAGDPPCESWGPQPYSKELPKYAWGTKFVYTSDGTDFEIVSYGKGRRAGGDGAAKDISSKNLGSK